MWKLLSERVLLLLPVYPRKEQASNCTCLEVDEESACSLSLRGRVLSLSSAQTIVKSRVPIDWQYFGCAKTKKIFGRHLKLYVHSI